MHGWRYEGTAIVCKRAFYNRWVDMRQRQSERRTDRQIVICVDLKAEQGLSHAPSRMCRCAQVFPQDRWIRTRGLWENWWLLSLTLICNKLQLRLHRYLQFAYVSFLLHHVTLSHLYLISLTDDNFSTWLCNCSTGRCIICLSKAGPDSCKFSY